MTIREKVAAIAGAIALVATACVEPPNPTSGANPYPLLGDDPTIVLADWAEQVFEEADAFDTGLGIYTDGMLTAPDSLVRWRAGDVNHSILATSSLAFAAALEEQITGSPAAMDRMLHIADGLHAAAQISRHSTDVLPGFESTPYLARWVGPRSDANMGWLGIWDDDCYYGAGLCPVQDGTPWGDIAWVSQTSGDMHIHWYAAMSVLHERITDPVVRTRIETDVEEITDQLMAQNWVIIDPLTGAPTLYHDIIGSMRLAMLKIAHQVTGEQRYHDAYVNDVATWLALPVLSNSEIFQYTNSFNIGLTETAFFHVIRLETNPGRRAQLVSAYRDNVRTVSGDEYWNLFDQYAAFNGVESLDQVEAQTIPILEGLGAPTRRFGNFPDPLPATVPLDPTSVTLSSAPNFYLQTLHPLPPHMWCPGADYTHAPHRRLSCTPEHGEWISDDTRDAILGWDFLLSYWMGRVNGVLDPTD